MPAQSLESATPNRVARAPLLIRQGDHWLGRFQAMGCPCEVLIENAPEAVVRAVLDAVASSAWRIEARFSRYRADNVVHQINTSNGAPITVDDETANLLDYAAQLTELSDGAFDISSGVLRRCWTFDGGDRVPSQEQIDAIRALVGWDKVVWKRPVLQMRPNMQIDFGGIGKEYAVDLAVGAAHAIAPDVSCLVNFGGDIVAKTPRGDGKPWLVGIESSKHEGLATKTIALRTGALATSGDSRRFVLKDGKRYCHVLDARTGWPVVGAPRSVTVLADTCTQAGTFSTLALLRGAEAEAFLKTQGVRFWLQQ
jgi:thiamine biosynthesis lipoprotein